MNNKYFIKNTRGEVTSLLIKRVSDTLEPKKIKIKDYPILRLSGTVSQQPESGRHMQRLP